MLRESGPHQCGLARLGLPSGRAQSLAFAQLNLRRNPFGEVEPWLWARLAVVDVDRVLPRLGQPGYAVQFTGAQGRGKTTHLLAIREHFPDAVYLHILEEGRPPPIPHGHPLLIDEIQRLPLRQRLRLWRRRVSFALGTHEDLGAELHAAGFEVHTVCVGEQLDAARLHEILNRRIEAARRGPGRVPQVTLQSARRLTSRFGDDLRAIQAHLYELFQDLPGVQDV